MGVSFIPSEFFGISGLGKSLGRIGDRQKEDEEVARREKQQELANTLAVEEAAIRRFETINELAKQAPGDQGLSLRQHALDGLATANLVSTDIRLKLTPEDINANQETLALATPANARTPEQWLLVGQRMGLPVGFTPETVMLTVENKLKEQGFNLGVLQDSEDAREGFKKAREAAGLSPGQIEFETSIAGLADLRAGTTLQESQALSADAQARLADARSKDLLGTEASDLAVARLRILEPFLKNMADHGVDGRIGFKVANGEQLTPEEEKTVTDALVSISRSASGADDKMKLLSDMLKIKELSEGTHALAIAGIAASVFGEGVVVATPKRGIFGGEKEGYELTIDLPLAISRMLSEDGKTGETQQNIEDVVSEMERDIKSISSKEELDVMIATVEGLEDFPLLPIFMQMIQERARELDGGAAGVIETQPADISSFTEEETIREEQKLRQELIAADAAVNRKEVNRIRARLLELERHRGSAFPISFSTRIFEDLRAQKNNLNKKRAALQTATSQIESFRTGEPGPNDNAIASIDAAIAKIDAEIVSKRKAIKRQASGGR